MKILILSWRDIRSPFSGGAEVFTFEVARRWVACGEEVTWFSSGFKSSPEEEIIDGIKIIRRGNERTVHDQAFKHYHKFFKGKFDLVIDEINTIPFFTPLYIKEKKFALIFQLARKVWFYETYFPLSLIGFLAECIYLKIYRNIPTITISESTKQDLLGLGFLKEIFIVPNGISFKPLEQVPQKEKNPTLISVGRLKSSKGLHSLLKAMYFIKKEIPSVKLRVIGPAINPAYLKKLLRLIKKFRLQNNVIFHGHVDETTKMDLLQKAHAIAVASVREGWGLVVSEANAMGTPAIGYNIPGLRDSIKNGDTGLLCEPTPRAMAQKAIELFKNNLLMKKLSENALKWSREFNWDESANKFMQFVNTK
ncbi:MAG: glycosyltransferase family 4 protein [Candidatus Omnitrophica bacterium]|nr:glycosyltransferase family 4 protein [Candidatus Omnitrophota bacterium]